MSWFHGEVLLDRAARIGFTVGMTFGLAMRMEPSPRDHRADRCLAARWRSVRAMTRQFRSLALSVVGGLGLAVAAILPLQPAWAQEVDLDSADYIMPGCRQFIVSNTPSYFLEGNCNGIIETLQFMSPDVCAPPNSTLIEAARIVVRYIDQRPDRQQENFRLLALEALTEAWPCRR